MKNTGNVHWRTCDFHHLTIDEFSIIKVSKVAASEECANLFSSWTYSDIQNTWTEFPMKSKKLCLKDAIWIEFSPTVKSRSPRITFRSIYRCDHHKFMEMRTAVQFSNFPFNSSETNINWKRSQFSWKQKQCVFFLEVVQKKIIINLFISQKQKIRCNNNVHQTKIYLVYDCIVNWFPSSPARPYREWV